MSHSHDVPRLVVIGGGAAGYFGAINAAVARPELRVTILEASRRVLTKVQISGGGRCNVTHHCFDPAELVKNYPRGQRELRGPFTRFQPKDTVQWFARRGVTLKAEADGRMFPDTDDSRTIVDCLSQTALEHGVHLRLGASVSGLAVKENRFELSLKDGETVTADAVLVATGSSAHVWQWLEELGHTLVPPVPSLFTFKIADPRLEGLAGLSFEHVHLELGFADEKTKLTRDGPLLITHWGLSGPAVLKLSAFGARPLHAHEYRASLRINFLPTLNSDSALQELMTCKNTHPRRAVAGQAPWSEVPRRFWQSLTAFCGIDVDTTYADISKAQLQKLTSELTGGLYQVDGKGIFKEEFVTAGGVSLKDVDFRTMQSRRVPGLYFAGEVLDIDGITGGFNFQAAWTTSWIAAQAIVASLA